MTLLQKHIHLITFIEIKVFDKVQERINIGAQTMTLNGKLKWWLGAFFKDFVFLINKVNLQ